MKELLKESFMVKETITVSSKTIVKILLSVISFLLLVNLLIIYLRFVKGYEHLRGFIHGFYFDAEANFPSFYSAIAIGFSALLLWLIGTSDEERVKGRALHWKFLAVVFCFLALDEFGSLHEYMIQPVKALVEQSAIRSDYLYFAWFIPYMVVALAVGIIFLKVLLSLPSRTKILFVMAGIVFLCGAVVFEMIGGKYWAEQGWAVEGSDDVDLTYALIITAEELLEMLGIVIFIYALMSYYLKDKKDHEFNFRISDA